ncbi:MAG: TatD family deoxyribonuclease [Gammaproteobacteria bacterium]|nr:MAG: TatD family deoxyribonuclease [Gammaproteobacteria bacterium]
MLVDSHCHLDRLADDLDRARLEAYLEEALAAGVGHLLCVSVDLAHWPRMRELVDPYPFVSVSLGVHPCHVASGIPEAEALAERARQDARILALGETGLDYHYVRDETERARQREAFARHCTAARLAGLPVIVHTREARADTLAILQDLDIGATGGVLHCFTEDWETARRALDLGLYLSFSGIVTFRSADRLREVARKVPSDRYLVETDAPWLAPVPHRGQANRPAWVREVARCVAEVRGIPLERLEEETTENFRRLFTRARVTPAQATLSSRSQDSSHSVTTARL